MHLYMVVLLWTIPTLMISHYVDLVQGGYGVVVAPYDSCTLYHGFESRSSRDIFRPPIGGQSRPRVSAGPVTHLYESVSLTNGMVVLAVQTPLMPVWLGSENTCRVGSVRPHPEWRTPVTGRLTPHTHTLSVDLGLVGDIFLDIGILAFLLGNRLHKDNNQCSDVYIMIILYMCRHNDNVSYVAAWHMAKHNGAQIKCIFTCDNHITNAGHNPVAQASWQGEYMIIRCRFITHKKHVHKAWVICWIALQSAT